MYKYILEGAGDINWMAIFALLTFFIVFVVAAVQILRSDKAFISKMANMPLNDEPTFSKNEIPDNHEK
jgi:uncharacterized membrane protein (DUF485 family)